ncbi:cohesin domain-containing protein, partial [Paenibacillus planticolens]|uniref:cohesin domain-containing protein n=1 Tax=Paenibacillus planticolens TaxID=2654976 RepID=UPI001492AA5B
IVTVNFEPQTVRYFKVIQTGTASNWWSIRELRVYGLTAASASLTVPANVTSGQNFDATVELDSVVSSVYAQDINFTYDPNVVEFLSAESIQSKIVIAAQSNAGGRLRFLTANIGGGSVNGALLKLHWKAKETADNVSTTIALSSIALADLQKETNLDGSSKVILVKAIVDLTELRALISNAQTQHDAATEGYSSGQYPIGSKAKLQAAITSANNVANNPDATKSEVAGAITALTAALQAFTSSVYTSDPADMNNDGKFTVVDLAIVAAAYGKTSSDPDWEMYKRADYNRDGKVDLTDLAAVAQRILQ